MKVDKNMIDVHSHILPGVDDGADNMDETLQLLKEAKNAGFKKVIFTPHYKEGVFEVEFSEQQKLYLEVCKLAEKEIPDLKLYLGNEIMATGNIIEYLENYKATTINLTSYILFELPMISKPVIFNDIVDELKNTKVVPILAHPERYSYVQNNPEIIYDWINMGVYMQQNFGSIIGQYGKKAQMIAKKMLETDSVHFLGSDVHRVNTVYQNISEILDEINSIVGAEKLKELTEINPNHVLRNERINIFTPTKIELSFFEKLKMK